MRLRVKEKRDRPLKQVLGPSRTLQAAGAVGPCGVGGELPYSPRRRQIDRI